MQRRPVLPTLLLSLALLTASCAGLVDQLSNLPELTQKDLRFRLAESSKIFDGDGNLITTLHETENRTVIPLKKVPAHVQDAVIAIEDERFYEHDGVDLRAIARALVANARSGEIEEGGSTITQQYVKNVIIAPGATAEKTLERKITEAALSRQLEKRLSKKQILERYLNTVYFGEGAYGLQAAASTYFGKTASKLTLSEGAMLAGIIRSPEDYDPYKHPKTAKIRRNLVIKKMLDLDMIDAEHAGKAAEQKIKLQEVRAKDQYPAPYFIDYVQRMITYDPRFDVVGKTREDRIEQLFQGGLEIYTTVDLEMQAAAEAAAEGQLSYPDDPHASVVAIDPNNGYVKAMVGGRDWFAGKKEDRFAKINLAILAEPGLGRVEVPDSTEDKDKKPETENRAPGTGRQAGSAFKVFALAAAMEQGIPLSKTYKAGSSMTFPTATGPYTVQNYEGGSFGSQLSLLEATVNSVNVVYAQLVINDVGLEPVVETAEAMGINTELRAVESAVLGTNEVNPLDMASAYGTLATNGEHTPPVAITKIVDTSGREDKVIYRDETESEQALDPAAAYLTTSALDDVIARGTGTNAAIGRPAAGKTGTAQEYRDAWFVGYTPDLVAAVWVGYPEGQIEMKSSCSGATNLCRPTRVISGTGVTGGSWPALIWQSFMLRALGGIPASSFDVPNIGLVTVVIDTRTGCRATRLTPDEYRASASFPRGTEPEEACRVEGEGERVPDVFGFPVDEAIGVLNRAGFEVETVDEPSSTYPPGRVIGQSPDGGSKAPEGSTVTIAVSVRGNGSDGSGDDESGSVPDVLGYTRGAAEASIRNAGFAVDVITERESAPGQAKKRSGRVWKQSPSGGSSASRGSTVTIWVNP